jgi:LAO/AO transport system kinase
LARSGDPRSVARLLSVAEQGGADLRGVLTQLSEGAVGAHLIGITGAPGVGKSTITSALVGSYRAAGKRVAVLAVDPSSPFSGGALLGDRVRMQEHALDREVFIRSMAARGHLGGLSAGAPAALRVLSGVGFEVVLIETVGVGQSEVEIARLADTTLVVMAPGLGDSIQAAKAGILEIGDVYVVNKADREGAQRLRGDLRSMVALGGRVDGAWRPPIVCTVAHQGDGVDELAAAISAHRHWLDESGELAQRRTHRARAEIEAIALAGLRSTWEARVGGATLGGLATEVADGRLDPYAAADQLLGAPSAT